MPYVDPRTGQVLGGGGLTGGAFPAQQMQQPAPPPTDYSKLTPEQLAARMMQGKLQGSAGAGNADLQGATAYAHRNDPNSFGEQAAYANAAQSQTSGWNPYADINAYSIGGNPNFAANKATDLYGMAGEAGHMTAPGIDTSAVNPLQGQATAAGNAAMGISGQLQGLAGMPAGPSAAELAMRQQGEQAQNAQASMAAGARGGDSALALQGAGANMAQIAGQENQQIGIQRASEDMANRQFAANTLGSAAGVAGGAAGIYGQGANLYGGLAQGQAGLQAGQNALNQAGAMGYQGMGIALQEGQASNMMQYDTQRTGDYLNYLHGQQQQGNFNTAESDKWKAAGLTAAGAAAGFVAGGPGGAAAGAAGGAAASKAVASDIRAKTNITPAGQDVSAAFRAADQSVQGMSQPTLYPNAPAYSYDYKNPNAPGAEPGRQFGPMAQDLEKTPAGASVVGEKNGRKFVDPGRLSLLTAAEVARQRQELDALMSARGPAAQIQQTPVSYPQPTMYSQQGFGGRA